jgi:hypothetical protein
MRMIHPAAWFGLFLNAAFTFLFFQTIQNLDLAAFEGAQQDFWRELQAVMLEMRSVYLAVLLAQAGALFLIVYRVSFAFVVALVSGVLTTPIGFVYLVGSMLTQYQVKYADFTSAPAVYGRARQIVPAFVLKRRRLFTGSSIAAFALFVFMKNFNMAASFFALGLVGMYCAARAGKNHALALHDDGLTLSPGLFAPSLLLPYSSITLATLHENQSIQFDVNTPGGPRSLVWSPFAVAPDQRREAVEELGAALDAHGVPLK